MLRVCTSNRTEALLEALVDRVRRERQEKGPFEPIRIVVPNRSVETYLRLNLAQALGIAANLEVTFLRKLLAPVAGAARAGTGTVRLVDAPQIQGHLLALFHDDDLLAQPAYEPVRSYLHAGQGGRDALDRRRCQLARRCSELFEEYSTSRAEMVQAWARGPTLAAQPAFAETESWQRALWLEIFGPRGRVARRSAAEGVSWLRLDELLARADGLGSQAVGGVLHLFGVSYMATAYHRMLAALARRIDVRLYTLNPCREFWEDVETPAERRRRERDDDPFGLQDDTENLALRLWGRPGRENVRLLGQHTDCDFDERFQPAGERPTLLQRLQNDVLNRAARQSPDASTHADGSLRVLRCPGIRRELEVTAAEIWACLRADPTLRCNDIAVIVPESRKQEYLSLVGAVFAESRELPASVVDLPLGGGNRLGTAVEMLLEVPLSSFTRRELVPLITHPCVMARFPEADPERWLELVDELGIVRGAEHADLQGTYIERDLFTWDQGLRRLALGAFMTGPASGATRPFDVGAHSYLPVETADDSSLQFGLLVRSLLSDARWARDGERPLGEWLAFMRGLLTTYLIPCDGAEEGLLARCLAELAGLEELDLGRLPISYRVAAELARQTLSGVSGTRGQYLASGVTVASFVPMRALPFRVVFVLGLGQENFPRPDTRDELDLRRARRAPGDVGRREQDLYMFLETLLCARDRLVLSYVGRDEVTGEDLPASSVLFDLRDMLARDHLEAPEVKALFEDERPPLRRFHDDRRLDALPAAHREHIAERLGQALRQAATGPLPHELSALRAALSEPARELVDGHLGLPRLPHASAAPSVERITVTLAQLRHFLEDPLQGSARFRLRMREEEDDEAEVEDEPFEIPRRERARLLGQALTQAVLAAADARPAWQTVLSTWEEWLLQAELAGHAPTGFFRHAGRAVNETLLRHWHDLLHAELATPARGQVVRWGRADEHAAGGVREAIVLDLPGLQVELSGSTRLLVEQDSGRSSLHFSSASKYDQEQSRRDKDTLRAFLDYVALTAGGLGQAHGSLVLWSDGRTPRPFAHRFAPLEAPRARAYLTNLVQDLLAGTRDSANRPTDVHAYLLPCEAVFEARRSGTSPVVQAQELCERYLSSDKRFSSVYGPVPDAVERHRPPAEDEARHMVEQRFALFFELLEPTGGTAPSDEVQAKRNGRRSKR